MKLITLLLNCSRNHRVSLSMVVAVALTGVVSGAINIALLALINTALNRTQAASTVAIVTFATLCVLLPLFRFTSEYLLVQLSSRAIFELRMQLSRNILAAPLRMLEELGTHRLLATLTDDMPIISAALSTLPLICMHVAIVGGALIYLGWLSPLGLLGVLIFIAVGVFVYQVMMVKALRYFRLTREKLDVLFQNFRALTEGTKELKLHRRRRESFLTNELEATAGFIRRHNVTGNTIYAAGRSWGQVLVFVLLGLLLFVRPNVVGVEQTVLTGFVLTLLFLTTPLEVILNALPTLSRAKVAAEKVQELGLSLAASTTESVVPLDAGTMRMDRLELTDVTHTYYREREDDSFVLGPINLKFEPGDLVFLIGGNGSGKTTLLKLITGLYVPEGGEIRLNGRIVDDQTRDFYRQHFSVVFSDFFLFETLLGLETNELDEEARRFLMQLQLDHKVKVKDGVLSTTELSQGQRKRLALLTAFLEDRSLYVFDEWAADQDPHFKEIFYFTILPELKARGKTVIITSHDDHYYHMADRIIKLDYGQIDSDRYVAELPFASMSM
jgi:putative pyoverdin transport system ATP-binding/permease protein